METKKLSLKNVKNALSRAELKEIMAGGSSCCNNGSGGGCPTNTPVYYCTEPGYTPWTTEWCCGGTPNYVGNFTCTLLGYTPHQSSTNYC